LPPFVPLHLAAEGAAQLVVKVVVDREKSVIHFLNDARHSFHAICVGEEILGVPEERVRAEIDSYNQDFYDAPDRRFLLGILARHPQMLSLETVEVDTMPAALIREFHAFVAQYVDPALPLLFKPANQPQERIPASELPRVFAHELFSTAPFVALNPGTATSRLRAYRTEAEYRAATLDWSDIIVMDRVPDDIPRLSGIVNARHTTPLSHTNVLATGWRIPNAVQLGALADIELRGLDGKWVEYTVDDRALSLREIPEPAAATPPSWYAQRVTPEEPKSGPSPIVNLARLRAADRYRYGTKQEIEPLCIELQSLIRSARMPGALAGEIDSALVSQLAGVRTFVSPRVTDVVDGSALPMQYLYSTVAGGGRTVSLGDAAADLDEAAHEQLQRLAIASRLLQGTSRPATRSARRWTSSGSPTATTSTSCSCVLTLLEFPGDTTMLGLRLPANPAVRTCTSTCTLPVRASTTFGSKAPAARTA
jgi:hypothetical protein